MTRDVLKLPHFWIIAVVILLMAVKSKRQGWAPPLIDDFVELVAYFAGLYGTVSLFREGLARGIDLGLPLFACAALFAFVSVRGIWRTMKKGDPIPSQAPAPALAPPPAVAGVEGVDAVVVAVQANDSDPPR